MKKKRGTRSRLHSVVLKPCPFCGCDMGVLELGGGFEWYGRHKSMCPLECNPSGSYGRVGDMADAWNMRLENSAISGKSRY